MRVSSLRLLLIPSHFYSDRYYLNSAWTSSELPFIFPTLLVTSQKVRVGGEKGLDKIEGVWYEQDG